MGDIAYTLEEFTAGDGYRWRYRRYAPEGTVRGEIVFLHGIQSHGGWYEYSCPQLARAGYGVIARSDGVAASRGERGRMACSDAIEDEVTGLLVPRAATPLHCALCSSACSATRS